MNAKIFFKIKFNNETLLKKISIFYSYNLLNRTFMKILTRTTHKIKHAEKYKMCFQKWRVLSIQLVYVLYIFGRVKE